MSLAIQVAAKTDVGCVRCNNEDSYGYDASHGIFVVCDGMGGQAAGEVASKIAVETLLTYFRDGVSPATATENSADGRPLGNAICQANRAIREAAGLDEKRSGMGSTVVCVLVDDNLVSVGHLGDSRVYLIREDEIRQLTQDHSFVMEQVSLGLISSEQAGDLQLQNIITRALGPEEIVEPEVDDMIVGANDVLLLATDGLTKLIGKEEILSAIKHTEDLESTCGHLIALAKELGGDDNITCLLIRFVEEKWYQAMGRRFGIGGSNNGSVVSNI